MKKELVDQFNSACEKAKTISDLPNLSEEQYEKIFQHVSITAMEATIRTINYAYRRITQEAAAAENA